MLVDQVKGAVVEGLEVLKREALDVVHPADRLFANLLLTRPLDPAALLDLAGRVLRLYRAVLMQHAVFLPAGRDIEEAVQEEAMYAGLADLQLEAEEIPAGAQRVYLAHERIIVEFPYEMSKQMALAPLKESVSDWAFNRYHNKEWSYPLEAIEQVVEALLPFPTFAFGPQATLLHHRAQRTMAYRQEVARFEQYWQELEHLEAQKCLNEILVGPNLPDGRSLYAHQHEAVLRLVAQGRLILAHDLGLGKTLSALLAARAYRRPIWVIAPISTHIPWLREAEALGISIEIFSWAKMPAAPEVQFVLIGDEAHAIQSLQSQRTRAFLALAERATAVFMLSGTPMKNAQATNLYPLLVACKHPLGQDQLAYEARYCSTYLRKIGKRSVYEATGAVHLDELHEKTRDVILFKRKSECLDLPPKVRVLRPAETTPEVEARYEETIERLWKEHKARMRARQQAAQEMLEAAREEGEDIDLKVLEAVGSDTSFANALVEMGILRHAASLAKIDAAIAVAEEVLDQGGSIVLFSVYRDTAEQLALLLHADCLSGETPAKERQAMIDRFQARETRCLVCTAAGGLGITLTAAQTVVLVERPWTPGDVVQFEDRIYRIGQVGTVTSIWLQYGLMDDRVDHLLEQKQQVIDQVLVSQDQAAVVEVSGIYQSVLSAAREILRSIHEGIPLDQLLSRREKELIAQAEAAAARRLSVPPAPKASTTRPQKRAKAGRPRKGGDAAELRQGFEITLATETLKLLSSQTTNRSAYIERLILEEDERDDQAAQQQMVAKLETRYAHFPPQVVTALQQIQDRRGARAALEASDAVALALDPGRSRIP